MLNSHGHSDHIGGNFRFPQVYAHRGDWPLLAAYARLTGRETPVCPLEPGQSFALGGRRAEVISLAGHTKGSVGLLLAGEGLSGRGRAEPDPPAAGGGGRPPVPAAPDVGGGPAPPLCPLPVQPCPPPPAQSPGGGPSASPGPAPAGGPFPPRPLRPPGLPEPVPGTGQPVGAAHRPGIGRGGGVLILKKGPMPFVAWGQKHKNSGYSAWNTHCNKFDRSTPL
ncbi:MAG: hypothetical protein ACLR6W_04365 [Evtepia sp.]